MKIAILGWGSLVWDPRDLPLSSKWSVGGPSLPIEFSRISGDGRLTLVIDRVNGVGVASRFATSSRSDLQWAVEDLRRREGPTKRENIGSVIALRPPVPDEADLARHIASWCGTLGFDAAVWTALGANFRDSRNMSFTVAAAMSYLKELTGETRRLAVEYVSRAPEEVDTPVRRAFVASDLARDA